MARSQSARRRSLRGFLILVAVVLVGGVILQAHGDLVNPLESTQLLLNLSSGADGFSMAGGPPSSARPAAGSSTAPTSESAPAASSASTGGTMTMDTFTSELTAAGVDVNAVSASMSAEGRSLNNLLTVVNSGRVTVADLATRLKGQTASTGAAPQSSQAAPAEGGFERGQSEGLLDIRWEAIGSVVYDLWFILAVTAALIAVRYSFDWLTSRFKQAQPTTNA